MLVPEVPPTQAEPARTAVAAAPRPFPERVLGAAAPLGTVLVLAGIALVGLLDLLPSSAPLRRTISHYALTDARWVFDLALLILAAGSAVILVGLVRKGVTRPAAPATVFLGLWVVGLVIVVLFPKHDWSVGPSMSGDIHRIGSALAFLGLPIAALLLARPWLREAAARGFARTVWWLGLVSLLWFPPLIAVIAYYGPLGVAWWEIFPLGLWERLLAFTEVMAVVALGWWAHRIPANGGKLQADTSNFSA
ncbi:DUF998 domain-containing protein [Crossiella cryophila]|uniref:DUF998 domain-containing protein n=1 Tax=Crossiella cryophila TaxID=43355 RepID=A0A7W7CH35_9PSEU|nr:DUF998 domain-containing protein [Crossiella cryophila]MBB4681088.1 hypothetical protein [Crossiella cryophila]